MNGSVIDIKLIGQDLASAVINGVKSNIHKLADSVKGNLTQGIQQFQNAIKTLGVVSAGAIAAGGVFIAKSAIEQASAFEKYEAVLKTMLGSSELAKKRLEEYADIGKKTPFELSEVVELGNQLQALGRYTRENVIQLGDLAAASGKPIQQVSGAFAKLASGQKGVAVDMFRDLLITTDDWVKATGKGMTKSGELMATTEEMIAALPKIMNAKKFNGMMDNLSQTFEGKMSNLIDSLNQKFRELGNKVLPYIKPIIDTLIELVSSIDIDKVLSDIANGFQQVRDFAQPFIDESSPKIKEFFDYLIQNKDATVFAISAIGIVLMATLVPAIWAAVSPILVLIGVLALVGVVAFALYKIWDENMWGIKDSILNVWNNYILPAFNAIYNWFTIEIPKAIDRLVWFWNNVLVPIFGVLKWWWDNVTWPVIRFIIEVFTSILNVAINKFRENWNRLMLVFELLRVAYNTHVAPIVDQVIDKFNSMRPVFEGIASFMGNVFKGALNGFIGIINNALSSLNNLIRQANNVPGVKITEFGMIPELATGTNFVPKDMLAILHKGERVVPAKYNPDNPSAQMSEGQGKDIELNVTVNNNGNSLNGNQLAGDMLFLLNMI